MILQARLIIPWLVLGLALAGCEQVARLNPARDVPSDVVALIRAIDAGDHAELERLLKAGGRPTPRGSPLSPLRAAITHFRNGELVCDSRALKLLLDHGADPNFVDPYSGFAPLESSLSLGEIECTRLLKAKGADENRHGKSGQSMLVFAVKGGLHTGDADIVKLVLSWGVDPNALDSDGRRYPPLVEAVAANWGRVDEVPVVKELLRGGADPCAVSESGRTAFDYAVRNERPLVQQILADAMRSCRPLLHSRKVQG